MAEYDIFREQLALKYPAHGHALWEPSPWKLDRPVEVGDVGFIRNGRFHGLFNALRPAEGQSNVPEYYEQLSPKFSDHISRSFLNSNHYCSSGISVEPEPEFHASSPDDFRQVSFKCSSRRGGAILSLPVMVRREDTLARGDFGAWIVKHIDRWFAFARGLGLGIKQMEEIVLVTGCDRTRSWTNVAFFGNEYNAQATFGVKVVHGPAVSIEWQSLPELVQGGVLQRGPDGTNLPEDQCIFIRGFRVARTFRILPKHLKAAGDPSGPSPDPDNYDHGSGIEAISIPETPEYRDPLQVLLDYIAKRAPDCDKLLVHDDDLKMIDGIGQGPSLGPLQSHMVDFLRRSNAQIHTVQCDLSHITGNSNTNSNTEAVRVAMFSMQNWTQPPAARNTPNSFTHSTNNSGVAIGGGYSERGIVRKRCHECLRLIAENAETYARDFCSQLCQNANHGNRISSRAEQPLRTQAWSLQPSYSSQPSTLRQDSQEQDALIPPRHSSNSLSRRSTSAYDSQPRNQYLYGSSTGAGPNSYGLQNHQPAPPHSYRLQSPRSNVASSYAAGPSDSASNNYDLPIQQPVANSPYIYQPPSYPNNAVVTYTPAPPPIGVFGGSISQTTPNPQRANTGISNLAQMEQQYPTSALPLQSRYALASAASLGMGSPLGQERPANTPHGHHLQSHQDITASSYAAGLPLSASDNYRLQNQQPGNLPHRNLLQSHQSNVASSYAAGPSVGASNNHYLPIQQPGQTTPSLQGIHAGNRNIAAIGQQPPTFSQYSLSEHGASIHNVQPQQPNFHGAPSGGLNHAGQPPGPREMPGSSTRYTNNTDQHYRKF